MERPRSLRFTSVLPFLEMCRFGWSEVTQWGKSPHVRREEGTLGRSRLRPFSSRIMEQGKPTVVHLHFYTHTHTHIGDTQIHKCIHDEMKFAELLDYCRPSQHWQHSVGAIPLSNSLLLSADTQTHTLSGPVCEFFCRLCSSPDAVAVHLSAQRTLLCKCIFTYCEEVAGL